MESSAIPGWLEEQTGGWKPAGKTTDLDLQEARQCLGEALLSGISPQDLNASPAFLTHIVRGKPGSMVAELNLPAALPSTQAGVLPRIRSDMDIDPAALSALAGEKITETFGPFVDSLGIQHWIDLIPLPHKINISSDTRGILGFLVVSAPAAKLGPGSLWISAAAFNISSAPTGAVGLSFSAGTVKTSGQVTMSPGGVTIGAGGLLTLELTLEPPKAPTGLPGVGQDAVQMSLTLPDQVTLVFSEAGVQVAAVADLAASVYGTGFKLKRNTAQPRFETIGVPYLLFPCDASLPQFSFKKVKSQVVDPSGKAAITGAAWGLQVNTAPPSNLGSAESAGSVVLLLGVGLSLERYGQVVSPLSIAHLSLALSPGTIIFAAVNGPRDVHECITLWQPQKVSSLVEPAPAQHDSEIDVTLPRGAVIFATVSPLEERTVALCSASLSVDRPLGADGQRIPLAFQRALVAHSHAAVDAVIIRLAQTATPDQRTVIALENALMRTGPAQRGLVYAHEHLGHLVGLLELSFDSPFVLPTLPDPYASANGVPVALQGTLVALDSWDAQPGAKPQFSFLPPAPAAGAAPAPADRATLASVRGVTTLLDLSSNADQFGVSMLFNASRAGGPASISADGMALALPQDQLAVYALPGISWEPVVDDSTGNWLNAPSDNDGPPTGLFVNTVNLVRVEPDAALPAFITGAATADTQARFTLPFGLMASLEMTANNPPGQRPDYSLIQADYANGLSAARQLAIKAVSKINIGAPALPGGVTTGSPLPVPLNSDVYGVLVLGNDPLGAAQFFDQEFAPGGGKFPEIPVERIDISGYGTSMFSDWHDPDFHVGVRRARFDVLLGRTAGEIVQIATVIIPYSIRITRTIIFERYDTGLLVRHDTGWQAAGNGAFELLQADQKLLGAVLDLENIHNINVGAGSNLSLEPPANPRELIFVPVTFDADVRLDNSVTSTVNGAVTPVVAGRQIQGYAQLTVGDVASAQEILQAMQALPNGVSGQLGAILNVGSAPGAATPKFTLNLSSFTVKATSANVAGQGYPAVGLALNGVPRLPRDGAWSIARRAQGDAQPSPVDPTFPVPLTFGTNNDGIFQWRLLDPSDALSSQSPATLFGLLQGTGTAKSLFENLVIDPSGQSLSLDPNLGVPVPKLADLGALLGASGIFPNLANVLQIPTAVGDALNLAQDGFQKTFTWTIEKPDHSFLDDEKLLDLGVVSLVLQYHGPDKSGKDSATSATFTINANPPAGQPRWALSLDHLSMAAFVAGFSSDPLITVHGGFSASETQKPGFNNIQIDYGSALSLVTNIISGLTTIVEAMGGAVDLNVGFSDNKLTVDDGFSLPSIPLGLGEIEDISIDLGLAITIPDQAEFHVELGTKEKPFTWIVDPLAGNGAIVLGTSGGGLGVYIEAGIGAALAIDLAVASGSASIILQLAISTQQSPFALTAALIGHAEVDVLGGLASASLTLAASITIVPHWPTPSGLPDPTHPLPNDVDFTGAVAVGIHISICWVVSIDFDGSWSFSQDIPLHLPAGIA